MQQAPTPEDAVAEPGAEGLLREKWGWPIAAIAIGMFMSVLDITIVNVAIPAIQYDFGGSLEDVLWIATAYTLTLGVVVPLTSWLGDRIGLTYLYMAAMLGFGITSAVCGLAWNLGVLIAARVFQAVPGGILPVVCVAILYRIVPKESVGSAMGFVGLAFVAAPAVGPVVGGYLVDHADWRWVFFINLPIGLVASIGTAYLVPKVPSIKTARFDIAGFATIAAGLSAILLGASKGEDWGWDSYRVLMLFVGGALLLALFVVIEFQVQHPLLELRLFRNPAFAVGSSLMALLTIGLLAGAFYIPVFLQQGQGSEAFVAGLVVFPQALGMCLASVLAGTFYDRLGPRLCCLIGCGFATWGNLLLCQITPATTHAEIIVWTTVRGFGMSFCAIGALTCAVNSVRPSRTNQASTIDNLLQQVLGAFGLAVLGTLLASQQAQLLADRSAMLSPDSELAHRAAPFLNSAALADPGIFAVLYRSASQLLVAVMADAMGNMFVMLTATMALGFLLSLLLPAKQPPLTEDDLEARIGRRRPSASVTTVPAVGPDSPPAVAAERPVVHV